MGQYIDYANVNAYVTQMKAVASNLEGVKQTLRYYYYSGNRNEGEFNVAIGSMRADIESTISTIQSFINNYADVIDRVAADYDEIDSQMDVAIQVAIQSVN